MQVLRFEQRGCGRSDQTGPYDLMTAVQDMDRLRQHFGFEQWTVGGHSWGANLAQVYALTFPDRIQGLLYIAGNGLQHNLEWRGVYRHGRDIKGEQYPNFDYPANLEVNEVANGSLYAYIQRPNLWRDIADLDVPAACAQSLSHPTSE